MLLFGFEHHKHHSPWEGAPPWAIELREMTVHVIQLERAIMSTLADIQAKQAATDAAITSINTGITAVAADVKSLQDKIANFPAGGLTPEQQAAIDDIANHTDTINTGLTGAATSLNAIDTSVNPPAPATPPATPPAS